MAEIVISEFMDEAAVADLRALFDVLYDKTLVDRPEELAAAVSGCRALIVRNRTQVRGALLDGARLRVVGRLGVGLDNIDCETCRARGITVVPATGANNTAVAEYVLAGLLMLMRGCYGGTASVASGAWPRERMVGGEIAGKTLGLVGFGGIARDVAARARACGMRVIAHDPLLSPDAPDWERLGVEPADLGSLLAAADAVSLHVPLTADTRHLLDAARLAGMKPGAVLINTSRGGVVDEVALAGALGSGRLAGALIDVFEKEPLPARSPLAEAPNCLLTPHIAGVTRESNVRVSAVVARKVAECLRGEA